MVRPRLVVVNAQSQQAQPSQSERPAFTERRSRPRHGTIKLIEDVVYRALREQAKQAPAPVPTFVPRLAAPPTMVLYSDPGIDLAETQPIASDAVAEFASAEAPPAVGEVLIGYAFRLAECKIFRLFRSKQTALSILKPAA